MPKKQKSDHAGSDRRLLLGVGAAMLAVALFAVGLVLGRYHQQDSREEATPMPQADAGSPHVASLADLLPGLEAKVAANPKDVDQCLLLAQTYSELGQRDKAIKELRIVHRVEPKNTEVTILLGAALMESESRRDLNEAFSLLDEAVRLKPAVSPMARLYEGDIRLKLGDSRGAVKIWQDYLNHTSAGDQRRAMFEEKIAAATGR
jgi:cytochrome c-type biogenesis protein CcmH